MEKHNGDAQELYELILKVANKFLTNAKRFEISVLRDHNPTYEELAEIMHTVGAMVYDLTSDTDPMIAQKALDYVQIMTKMSIAIRNDDKVGLSNLTLELDQKPFL